MALEAVQSGYRNSLYFYSATSKSEFDSDYSKLLAELTTELELACKGGEEEPVTEDDWEDSEQENPNLNRKKAMEDNVK